MLIPLLPDKTLDLAYPVLSFAGIFLGLAVSSQFWVIGLG